MDSTVIQAGTTSFKDFLFKDKRNKTILILAAIAIVIQFGIFKYFYPYASYIHGDSFAYLETAFRNLDVNTYMVGYSRFLRLFSVLTSSDFALTAFQYLSIQFGALFLLFTIFYFYKPSKVLQYVLLCFMVFNPLFLHLGNLVSSDCLFASFSLTWFALLLWIIHQPTNKIVVLHAAVLFLAFTFRYNALIYPVIAAIAFRLSSLPWRKKLMGIGAGLFLCGLFVGYTSYKFKKITGDWQYSPFSGWQLTNNAMYTYRYVNKADRKPVPKKFQAFDNMVRQYFDSTRDTKKFPVESMKASTVYMWSPGFPMMKYRDSLFKKDSTAFELKKWASMGPFYKAYGLYIIRQYPLEFLQHFIWPNGNKYYAPPVEFLDSYNSGKDEVNQMAKAWFGYKSLKVRTRMKDNTVWVLNFYPILSGIINAVMLFMLLFYWTLKGWRTNPIAKKGILIGSTVWLLNAGFTIGASSAALRFQSFPILLTTIFVALLVDWLWKVAMTTEVPKLHPGVEEVNPDLAMNVN
ncbi:hypothetical protein FAM09_13965 [Niastella caeni]|uniref:Glycosyltransferase RgtA/B/C/D-like domain-containing protein n=1 Tax=Niastella caeni TaxID=2569763 RepID=A0A4S8I1M3_9BACT|nr:hypothetical protein [Niastella caeni]THU39602.1 hypothetical protein FAM09_13965 [Niastella caeni]